MRVGLAQGVKATCTTLTCNKRSVNCPSKIWPLWSYFARAIDRSYNCYRSRSYKCPSHPAQDPPSCGHWLLPAQFGTLLVKTLYAMRRSFCERKKSSSRKPGSTWAVGKTRISIVIRPREVTGMQKPRWGWGALSRSWLDPGFTETLSPTTRVRRFAYCTWQGSPRGYAEPLH